MVAAIQDGDGKMARKLRLSITGECNLNCFYCRSTGAAKDLVPTKTLIQPSDVTKLVRILGEMGVSRVVIGGGEPLLRKDAASFVKSAYAHKAVAEVRLVTNGTFLKTFADPLRKLGLKKVDVNFDSLSFVKYQRITGVDNLYRVLDGIEKVEKLNYPEIRLNIFLLKGINDDEIIDFARMTKSRKLHIRFVEYGPNVRTYDPHVERLRVSVCHVQHTIDNFQRLVPMQDLMAEVPVPTYQFVGGAGKLSFLSEIEVRAEAAVPSVRFTADGVLINEQLPHRSEAILAALRRDAKEDKLHRAIEKILSVETAASRKKAMARGRVEMPRRRPLEPGSRAVSARP